MPSLPTNIFSAQSVRDIDRHAIASGTAGLTLMQRAGKFAFATALGLWPSAKRWQVVCGPGNNAGDGYIVAALARQRGFHVSVVTLTDVDNLQGDAALAYRHFVEAGGMVERWAGQSLAPADLVIDCLLGRGALRPVSGDFKAAIDAMNTQVAPILALDIASGIDADSGEAAGACVVASATCVFVALSAGLLLAEGRRCSGKLFFSDLQIAGSEAAAVSPMYQRLGRERREACLPARRHDSHKGDFGRVLVIGGGPGMPGAARICAEAALRAGAGRVSVATHPAHTDAIVAGCPELMVHGIESGQQLRQLIANVDVVAFGPGLGRSDWAHELCQEVEAHDGPAIWDADALNWLAEQPKLKLSRVITPHPGEAARLLGSSSSQVQGDRQQALSDLVARYGGVVVLKGAATLIASDSAVPWLNTTGNPGMAAPGTGDALTGIIAALIAQGMSLELSAALGVWLHGAAGDRAAQAGERGLMASDLIAKLRSVAN